ncbi:dephospho-CoA kinase [Niabella ginsenosidivorans]|uniref:Dephospho-CoA kinase n=1 Tax=Niabella ginsenosidivorans TaxID=1176587 RepID=A0A1A9I1E5_9BACT|nr:dephospho-CoA kinase [Niabella ginsenosidivorans]ANH81155.1 dephospho-CoA kinase [Niabella ginsenosidivorans]
MLKVGITGGIGSGKTLAASLFKTLGIPVYDADAAAKRLMSTSKSLQQQLIAAFGEEAFKNGQLDRAFLAARVFGDDEQLKKINSIVHPAAIQDSQDWFKQQHAPYAIKEASILFETGSDQYLDYIIGVTAPEQLRIQRTIERSHLTEQQVRERMDKQMDETEKMRRCHFVINNNGHLSLIEQVVKIHEALLYKSARQ